MTAKNTRRSGPPRRSGGGLIVGIFVGLLLGLAIALGVALSPSGNAGWTGVGEVVLP